MTNETTINNTPDVSDKTQKSTEEGWISFAIKVVVFGLLCGWFNGCSLFADSFPYKSADAVVERFNSTIETTFSANNVSGANAYKLPDIKNWRKSTPNAKTEVYYYKDGPNEFTINSSDKKMLFKVTVQTITNEKQNLGIVANSLRLVDDDFVTIFNNIRTNRRQGFDGLGVYEYYDSKKGVSYEFKEVGPVGELTIIMPKG